MLNEIEQLWAKTKGNSSITIAVLDGAIQANHPCFEGAKLNILPSVAHSTHPSNHGTQVTSIIFGQHGSAVKGVAPNCKGLIIPIFETGTNNLIQGTNQTNLARAIDLALEHGANIINISGGKLDNTGEAEQFLKNSLLKCEKNNVLVVAAAGNDGCQCVHVPAATPSVLAVGAIDSNGEPLSISNWGDDYKKNGVLAQGKNILGATVGGNTQIGTGTSFAAPMVSGIVALLLSLQIEQGKTPDPMAVKEAILSSSTRCIPDAKQSCKRHLVGTINIANVLSKLEISPSELLEEHVLVDISSDSNSTNEILLSNYKNKINMKDVNPNMELLENIKPSDASYIDPSDCGCNGGNDKQAPQVVYALGTLGFDYSNDAVRDSFIQRMATGSNVNDPATLLEYLDTNPYAATDVIWTLNQEATPIYGIMGGGPYAAFTYETIRAFLADQIKNGSERVSIPGVIVGKTRLSSGQIVPVVVPNVRGMYAWTTGELLKALNPANTDDNLLGEETTQKVDQMQNFFERVYHELRNLGASSHDRAINYAATNAFQVSAIYKDSLAKGLELKGIDVEKSPVARPGADAYDVKLTFFNPSDINTAKKVYRFTVDVSEVLPVTVGSIRSWSVS